MGIWGMIKGFVVIMEEKAGSLSIVHNIINERIFI